MPDLVPRVTDEQRLFLETLYEVFRQTCGWPTYQYVARILDDMGIAADAVLDSIPHGLYWPADPSRGVVWLADDEKLGLRVRGLACCRDSATDIACFLATVRFVVATWRGARPDSPQSVVEPVLRFADFVGPVESIAGPNPDLYRVLLTLELMRVEPSLPPWEGSLEDPVQRYVRLSRSVLRYRDIESVVGFLARLPDTSAIQDRGSPSLPLLEGSKRRRSASVS